MGKLLLVAGMVLVLIGLALTLGGKLPGDIFIEREKFSFSFPLGTCLLISLLLSFLLWLFHR